jgi:hypothetical protein
VATRDYTLALTGAAQRLSDVYGDGVGVVNAVNDIAYRELILAQDPANAAAIFVGASASVSSTAFGFSLDPTEATAQDKVYLGPFDGGAIKLSQLWVIGTATQKLHIFGIPD